MIFKGIGATTEVDRHNCKITKEALENAMVNINEGIYAPGVGLEHDNSIMPIGKTIKGEIVPYKKGEFAAQIYQDIFFDDFIKKSTINGEIIYVGESQYDHRPFADAEKEDVSKMRISIDPVNFSHNDYEEMAQFITNDCNADHQSILRKSLIPDPEIVFNVIAGTFLYWTGKKSLEKLSDNVSTDIASCYTRIKKAITKIVQYANPKNRPITYVLRESDEYVTELIIQTTNIDDVLEAIKSEKVFQVFEKINQVSPLINGTVAKIQFIYDCKNSKWEFNYMTSKTGQVLGTEKCYKRTAKVFENVIRQASNQYSISDNASGSKEKKCQNNQQQ